MSEINESFRPIRVDYDDTQRFSCPELLYATSGAKLYRARKAGKFFMLKTPAENRGMYIELLKREYELSIGFSHPHLINVFTYEPRTEVGPAIVMEYIDGRNLAEYLKENPTLAARIRIFEQLLSAVACLHKADIIHNDLKPQNILITRANDDVKLIDFGLSDNSAHYLMKQMGGTLRYASPELLAQSGDTNARSDIYSVGCIMRDLFGERYKSIRKKCLQPQRDDRYDNVEALQLAWQHRKLPQHLALGFLLAAAIVLPSVGYISERRQQEQLQYEMSRQIAQYSSVTAALRNQIDSTQRQIDLRKSTMDSLQTLYDTQVSRAFALAKDTLLQIPYKEFAFTPVTHFVRYTWALDDSLTRLADDLAIQSQLATHFDALRNKLQTALYAIVEKKPTIRRNEMTEEEYLFYYELFSNHKGYRKYRP